MYCPNDPVTRGQNVSAAPSVFDFEVARSGQVYVGNPAQYGGLAWPEGLYALSADGATATLLVADDVNSVEVVTVGR